MTKTSKATFMTTKDETTRPPVPNNSNQNKTNFSQKFFSHKSLAAQEETKESQAAD